MVHYELVSNEKLRNLLLISESIQSLEEAEIQRIVEGIVLLSSDEQESMVKIFEDEQEKIAAIKKAKGINPVLEKQRLKEAILELKTMNFKLARTLRKENEKMEIDRSDVSAETLLQNL